MFNGSKAHLINDDQKENPDVSGYDERNHYNVMRGDNYDVNGKF